MKLFNSAAVAIVIAIGVAQPVLAKDGKKAFVVVNEAVGVPVFPHDITDRPYEVIGEIEAGVRKATLFSKEASQEKIYKELWERAEKRGADAVINAKYGESHITAFSWGKTNATGTAIRFVEAPAAAAQMPAATPDDAGATADTAQPVTPVEASAEAGATASSGLSSND